MDPHAKHDPISSSKARAAVSARTPPSSARPAGGSPAPSSSAPSSTSAQRAVQRRPGKQARQGKQAKAVPTNKAKAAGARSPGNAQRSKGSGARRWDLWAAAGLMGLAALLSFLPSQGVLAAVGIAILLFVPGYVLLQVTGQAPAPWHAIAALGVSIPVVALLALATSLVPGGFTGTVIVVTVSLGVLALAVVADRRRVAVAARA